MISLGMQNIKTFNSNHRELNLVLDLRLFNNRIGLDFAHYQRKATDQILAVPIANSTGYDTSFLNSGELETSGYEVIIKPQLNC